jgi:hypothetical protein
MGSIMRGETAVPKASAAESAVSAEGANYATNAGNADLLDNHDSSYFATADHSHTINGKSLSQTEVTLTGADINATVKDVTKTVTEHLTSLDTAISTKAEASTLNNYLPLTGGTLTGDLELSESNGILLQDGNGGSARLYADNPSVGTVIGVNLTGDLNKTEFLAFKSDLTNLATKSSVANTVKYYEAEQPTFDDNTSTFIICCGDASNLW